MVSDENIESQNTEDVESQNIEIHNVVSQNTERQNVQLQKVVVSQKDWIIWYVKSIVRIEKRLYLNLKFGISKTISLKMIVLQLVFIIQTDQF
jgi:hypothetical protein